MFSVLLLVSQPTFHFVTNLLFRMTLTSLEANHLSSLKRSQSESPFTHAVLPRNILGNESFQAKDILHRKPRTNPPSFNQHEKVSFPWCKSQANLRMFYIIRIVDIDRALPLTNQSQIQDRIGAIIIGNLWHPRFMALCEKENLSKEDQIPDLTLTFCQRRELVHSVSKSDW